MRQSFSAGIQSNKLAELWEERKRREERARIEGSFAEFVHKAWQILEPSRPLDWNWHHDVIVDHLEAFRRRDIQNLITNIPFRCSKSLLVSVFYPAWVWTTDSWHQFLCVTHADALALRDAGKMRMLIQSPWFQYLWGDRFSLRSDAIEYFWNSQNGHRVSQGMSGSVTGKGGDTIIIDDPHDAEKAQSDKERQNALDRYDEKISNRLNDPQKGGIILIMQRLHQADLTGHILKKEGQAADWTHLKIPMRFEGDKKCSNVRVKGVRCADPRKEVGELMWPDRFPGRVVRRFEEDLGSYGASGQLQQRPSPAGGGIIKKSWWQRWPEDRPLPVCQHIFQSWDTAYSENDLENHSRSARTSWGVFFDETKARYGLIMIDAWADWVDYPDLRREAKKVYRQQKPDAVLIEKKASGQSLVQDMRQAGIPVTTYQPDRDKVSRAYSVQALFEGGMIWAPNRRWADDVIEECANFPRGERNDYVDTVTQALLYVKARWLVQLPEDDPEEKMQRQTYGNDDEDEDNDSMITQRQSGGVYG